jgi:hypothetical protein
MSPLWWIPMALAAVAACTAGWGARRVAREVGALAASAAGLAELRTVRAEVEAEIASTWRSVEDLDLR